MTLLVLSYADLDSRPIGTWLRGAGDLLLVTSRSARAASPKSETALFREIMTVDDYFSQDVLIAAHALARRHPLAGVIASNESDLLRSAVLRERYRLPGQRVNEAMAFRDKLTMRRTAEAGGIAVPRFQDVRSLDDAMSFAVLHGFPVVMKPRRATGAQGVGVARTPAELRGAFAGASAFPGGLLVETRVDASIYHIDGVSDRGRVVHCWPSRYSAGALETVQRHAPRVSMLMGAADPLRPRLQEFAVAVIKAFPSSGPFSFHIEAWVDRGVPVLCEVTARTGGGPIAEAYRAAFGLDLSRESFLAQAGLPLTITEQPSAPLRYVGWIGFLTGDGLYTPPIRDRPPVLWFKDVREPGSYCRRATMMSDFAAYALVDGASAEEAEARGDDLIRWWDEGCPWR
ncbi:ATP-grasp domain-containing protein [Nonomuraea sp. CA-141351]|uniref:ATP-grasp domain-containing protein n=1 Tax=Nonomuraea sp. CA-141351 TaxID=3239996 RepID=UPI003D91CB63